MKKIIMDSKSIGLQDSNPRKARATQNNIFAERVCEKSRTDFLQEKLIVMDNKSNRYFDENGYLVIKDNKIAKAGVFDYLGKEIMENLPEGDIYKVYRPWEELEKTAKDFEGIPVKLGHEWVSPLKKDLKVGVVSGVIKLEEPYLIADIKIYDKDAIDEIINNNIVELSPGYTAKYIEEHGEYNNEKYEFRQEDIIYNHLAIVENGRSGKEVKIADELPKGSKNREVKDMPKNLKQTALYALSHAKKVYDECITSKTDDVDKRELIREIVALAVKPDTDFQGGEEEKFETILKKAEELGYEPSETSKTDDEDMPEEKTVDSDIAAMKEAFNSFASLFSDFLNEEEKEDVVAEDNETLLEKEQKDDKKETSDSMPAFSKKTMDAEIKKAILLERKRTQDAIAAYQDVERYVGSFNMSGMSEDEIYKYAYELLTGDKVKIVDAKPSFKAFKKAKAQDSNMNMKYSSNNDEIFTHIK